MAIGLYVSSIFEPEQTACPACQTVDTSCLNRIATAVNKERRKNDELFETALEERSVQCNQWAKCQEPIECDCSTDFDNGIIEGRAQAIKSAKMYSQ